MGISDKPLLWIQSIWQIDNLELMASLVVKRLLLTLVQQSRIQNGCQRGISAPNKEKTDAWNLLYTIAVLTVLQVINCIPQSHNLAYLSYLECLFTWRKKRYSTKNILLQSPLIRSCKPKNIQCLASNWLLPRMPQYQWYRG